MKKILVVDESHAVRETIHLVLGGDFAVAQKSSLDSLDFNEAGIDLLIVGVSAALEQPADLSDIARRSTSPVLFLVASPFIPADAPQRSGVDYLLKPFNPYSLKQKVAGLLSGARLRGGDAAAVLSARSLRYLDPPFVPAQISQLARKFADTPFPLLIVAEAGCGQEAIARAIHALGRPSAAWLSVHAAEAVGLEERVNALARGDAEAPLTLYIRDIDSMNPAAQSALLDFLLAEESRGRELRPLSNARADLMEKVYRGEFLDALYYRLATLVLALPALRDRPADIPMIAERLAEECSERLGFKKAQFSPAALERLRNYLWFGNLDELESVISRTLSVHGKELIDAPDLVLGEERPRPAAPSPVEILKPPAPDPPPAAISNQKPTEVSVWSNGHSQELKVLIGELAHELKNPMVTVKTFSQLLGDRFDDPAFRVRFQQTVNGDIQRMDDLLEALIAFSHFGRPEKENIMVYEHLRRVEEEILPECIKREAALQWGKRTEAAVVFADKAQFIFAFKNILCAVVAQVKPKSDIAVDVEEGGAVTISYSRETAGVGGIAEFVGATTASCGEEALPLRLLLANILLERNGAVVKIDNSDGQRSQLSADFPSETLRGYEVKP
jgi:DNA-binding NtrC family response regulator